MDINVKIRLESPELIGAIIALAEVLEDVKLGAFLPTKGGQALTLNDEIHSIQKKETLKEESKAISLEEVREKLAALSQAGKQKEVKVLIKKFGGNKLTEIDSENYEALLREADMI